MTLAAVGNNCFLSSQIRQHICSSTNSCEHDFCRTWLWMRNERFQWHGSEMKFPLRSQTMATTTKRMTTTWVWLDQSAPVISVSVRSSSSSNSRSRHQHDVSVAAANRRNRASRINFQSQMTSIKMQSIHVATRCHRRKWQLRWSSVHPSVRRQRQQSRASGEVSHRWPATISTVWWLRAYTHLRTSLSPRVAMQSAEDTAASVRRSVPLMTCPSHACPMCVKMLNTSYKNPSNCPISFSPCYIEYCAENSIQFPVIWDVEYTYNGFGKSATFHKCVTIFWKPYGEQWTRAISISKAAYQFSVRNDKWYWYRSKRLFSLERPWKCPYTW